MNLDDRDYHTLIILTLTRVCVDAIGHTNVSVSAKSCCIFPVEFHICQLIFDKLVATRV